MGGAVSFRKKSIIMCNLFLFQRSCLFTVSDVCFWTTWKVTWCISSPLCARYRLRASSCTQRVSAAQPRGPPCISSAPRVEHGVGPRLRGRFVFCHWMTLWTCLRSCSRSVLVKSQKRTAAKPKQEENQGDRDDPLSHYLCGLG